MSFLYMIDMKNENKEKEFAIEKKFIVIFC